MFAVPFTFITRILSFFVTIKSGIFRISGFNLKKLSTFLFFSSKPSLQIFHFSFIAHSINMSSPVLVTACLSK